MPGLYITIRDGFDKEPALNLLFNGRLLRESFGDNKKNIQFSSVLTFFALLVFLIS
jgi:hypothetical protein